MSKKVKIFDDKSSCSRSFSRIKSNDGNYLDGDVVTPNGIVSVYSQEGNSSNLTHTRLDFAYNGTFYMRNYDKGFAIPYLVTLSNRFTQEIIKNNE